MLHVWYIYLHLGDFARANVGKYSIHGAYGLSMMIFHSDVKLPDRVMGNMHYFVQNVSVFLATNAGMERLHIPNM